MAGKRQIEARWGVPFWQLVADFAHQGLSRFDTARALGYRPDSFCTLVRQHPKLDPFDASDRPLAYLQETGETLSCAVRRMVSQGMLATEIARVVGYRDACGLKRALKARMIVVEFPQRSLRHRKQSVREPGLYRGWPTWGRIDELLSRKANGSL